MKKAPKYVTTLFYLEVCVLIFSIIHSSLNPKGLGDYVGYGAYIADYGPYYFIALLLSPLIYIFIKYLIYENPFRKQQISKHF